MQTLNSYPAPSGHDVQGPQSDGDWETCRCRAHRIERHLRYHLYKWLLGVGATATVISNFRTAVDTVRDIIQFMSRFIIPLIR